MISTIQRVFRRHPILLVGILLLIVGLLAPTPDGPQDVSYGHMCRIRPSRRLCTWKGPLNAQQLSSRMILNRALLIDLTYYKDPAPTWGQWIACPTKDSALSEQKKEGKSLRD